MKEKPVTLEAGEGARAFEGGVRAGARPSWDATRTSPSWASSPSCGASTAPTSAPGSTSRSSRRRGRGSCRGPARTPAWWTSATGSRCPSRWRATTTPRSSSPTRARRPAWAASCATSSPWGPGPSLTSNSLRFGRPDHPRTRYLVDRRRGGDRGLRQLHRRPHRRRRGLLRRVLRREHPGQRLHPRGREDGIDLPRLRLGRRQPGHLRRVARRAATASTAPRWPPRSSTRSPRRSAPRSRWATPSPRSCSWRPASS